MSDRRYTCKICGWVAVGDRHERGVVWPYPHTPLQEWDRSRPMWIRERDGFGKTIKAREYHWTPSLPDELPPMLRAACGYRLSSYPLTALHEVGGHNICAKCRTESVTVIGDWAPKWTNEILPAK